MAAIRVVILVMVGNGPAAETDVYDVPGMTPAIAACCGSRRPCAEVCLRDGQSVIDGIREHLTEWLRIGRQPLDAAAAHALWAERVRLALGLTLTTYRITVHADALVPTSDAREALERGGGFRHDVAGAPSTRERMADGVEARCWYRHGDGVEHYTCAWRTPTGAVRCDTDILDMTPALEAIVLAALADGLDRAGTVSAATKITVTDERARCWADDLVVTSAPPAGRPLARDGARSIVTDDLATLRWARRYLTGAVAIEVPS